MEKKSAPSTFSRPALGGAFYFTLLLPLVLIGICVALVDRGDLLFAALGITGLVTLICSAFVATWLARRFSASGEAGAALIIAMFLAVQVFYVICFYLGSTVANFLG